MPRPWPTIRSEPRPTTLPNSNVLGLHEEKLDQHQYPIILTIFFVASLAVCLAGPWVRCPGARVGANALPWSPCSGRWSSRGWDGSESLCPHQVLIALQHLSFLAQKCGHHLLWSGHILSSSLSALCGFLCNWSLTSFQVRFLILLPAAQAVGEPDLTSFHHFFPKDNYCSNLGFFSVSNGGCISVMESLFCQYVFLSFLNLLFKFAELFFWQEELIVRLPKPTQQKSQLVLAYNCKASRNSFSNNPLQGSKKYLKCFFVKYFNLFVIDQINILLFHQMIGPRSYKYCAILTFLFSLSKHLLLCPDMVWLSTFYLVCTNYGWTIQCSPNCCHAAVFHCGDHDDSWWRGLSDIFFSS